VKRTLRAGLASWIPHVLNVAGYWLGILAVFSSEGASDGGRFYISVGIFAVTLFVVTGVTKVIHALIPRIRDENEQVKFLIYYTNIAFVFTMPFAIPLLYFSPDFLGLMGEDFIPAGASLSIFILSLPFVIVSEMIYYFAYGKGDHKSVLYLGLIGNVPRIILYFILAHFFGINGAAMSFFIGSVLQLVASIGYAKQHQIKFDSQKYLAFTLIPMAVGLLVWIANINYVISTLIIIVASFLLYIRFLLVTTDEVREITYAVLPHDLAAEIYPHLAKLVTKIASLKK
jgi:O-antigen/teichoic acid export membrane protein